MKIAAVILALSPVLMAGTGEDFGYPVFRGRLMRDEPGRLEISNEGVSYRSDNGKTVIKVSLVDILTADLSDPRIIRIETYDILKRRLAGRRVHTFRLREGTHNEALMRFLVGTLERPVIGAYGAEDTAGFEISSYHRHRFGGCHGTLHLARDAIRFVSRHPTDSRNWLYADIETIGSMSPFHFRVNALTETYNFDLKERLMQAAYRLAWQRLYELEGVVALGAADDAKSRGARH